VIVYVRVSHSALVDVDTGLREEVCAMFDTIGALWRMWEGLFAGTNMPWGQSATAAFGMVAAAYGLGWFIKNFIAPREQ
jgi:hypothetical protein